MNRPTEHGQPGHLNCYELDTESECTGFGKHRRCIVYGECDGSGVTVRTEANPTTGHLPEPTMAQLRKVAMGVQRVHGTGRLVFRRVTRWVRKSWDGRDVDTADFDFEVVR